MRRPFQKAAARLRVIQGQDPPFPVSAARAGLFGMKWFLASLSMLFITSLGACLLVTIQAGAWHSEAVPGLASRLWVSTVILLLVSVVLERGRQQIRLNHSQGLLIMLWLALALSLAFLASQTRVWLTLEHIQLPEKAKTLYAFSFGVLTGLHAVHVLGGFVPLTVCIVRASRESYSSYDHAGITYCAMYWHFLDAVWLVLVSAILLI
jgi:heme/copper-type cytochrome/quinol oxidase subunit 3